MRNVNRIYAEHADSGAAATIIHHIVAKTVARAGLSK